MGLAKQIAFVDAAMQSTPSVQVHGAICFVDAQLPWLGTLRFGGFPIVSPKGLAKRLRELVPLGADELAPHAPELAGRFPFA